MKDREELKLQGLLSDLTPRELAEVVAKDKDRFRLYKAVGETGWILVYKPNPRSPVVKVEIGSSGVSSLDQVLRGLQGALLTIDTLKPLEDRLKEVTKANVVLRSALGAAEAEARNLEKKWDALKELCAQRIDAINELRRRYEEAVAKDKQNVMLLDSLGNVTATGN